MSLKGATLRVSMPYLDPKIYDDGAYEAAKYAERRDDIGRLMLSVMVQARGGIAAGGGGGAMMLVVVARTLPRLHVRRMPARTRWPHERPRALPRGE
jgi:hypothetical protein